MNNIIQRLKDWWWFNVTIEQNEFHPSLDMDIKELIGRSKEEQTAYVYDLVKRRNKAHEKDNKWD